jgi:hypothetical protein
MRKGKSKNRKVKNRNKFKKKYKIILKSKLQKYKQNKGVVQIKNPLHIKIKRVIIHRQSKNKKNNIINKNLTNIQLINKNPQSQNIKNVHITLPNFKQISHNFSKAHQVNYKNKLIKNLKILEKGLMILFSAAP